MRGRRWLPTVLAVAFIGVPLLEIFVLVQIGQVIGAWWTILLLVLASVVGTWLVRREGTRAWQALTSALQTGRMPHRELADGALILVGGTLMLTPGFVSDAVGVLLILPFTRPLARRALAQVVARRLLGSPAPRDARRPGSSGQGPVVRGEVVDDDPSS
ncbi:MAG TPA: FxsA family protein [Nocardioides sp.]|nr:FxsA family protein [Nocardioides sp.]